MVKKLFGLIVLIVVLSSCQNTQNKFVSSDDKRITNEDWFMVSHADSSDLLPCIVMEDYILVIKDDMNKTEILKMEDMSGISATVGLVLAIFLFCSMVIVIIVTAKD